MYTYFSLFFVLMFFQCTNPKQDVQVYDVYEYGAKGDGKANDQQAIQKAIDACKNTGGTVLFKEGTFLTGQLVLGNDMTLQIDTTATIRGIQSDREEAYQHQMNETDFPN